MKDAKEKETLWKKSGLNFSAIIITFPFITLKSDAGGSIEKGGGETKSKDALNFILFFQK